MIDEELYQQAADELNSGRRRPHIWARACALASDDHDEARYLYTNLRVEELLAERETAGLASPEPYDSTRLDKTLAIEPPAPEEATVELSDKVGEYSALHDEEVEMTQAEFAKGDVNLAATQFDVDNPDFAPTTAHAELEDSTLQSAPAREVGSMDDTYAGMEDPTEVFQKELESLKAEQGGVNIFENTAAFSRHLDGYTDNAKENTKKAESIELDDTAVDYDGTAEFNLDPAEIDRLASLDPDDAAQFPNLSAENSEQTGTADTPSAEKDGNKQMSADSLELEDLPSDKADDPDAGSTDGSTETPSAEDKPLDKLLEDADYQPSEPLKSDPNQSSEVDDVLADTVYQPVTDSESKNDLDWLDEEPTESSSAANKREPVIIGDDTLEPVLEGKVVSEESEIPALDSVDPAIESDTPGLADENSTATDSATGMESSDDNASEDLDSTQKIDIDEIVPNPNLTTEQDEPLEAISEQSDATAETTTTEQTTVDGLSASSDGTPDESDTHIETTNDVSLSDQDSSSVTTHSASSDDVVDNLSSTTTDERPSSDAAIGDSETDGADTESAQSALSTAAAKSPAASESSADASADAQADSEQTESQEDQANVDAETLAAAMLPLDLTDSDSRKEFAIYRRRGKVQIVKNGASWSALLLTLPFLIYRHLFGTAIVYAITAIILLGGLIVSVLAWLDAGEAVTPLVQISAIGFGLLCFIGLFYLPFRYGNFWRGEKLENRGFALLANVNARSPGHALTRLRNHTNFDI